MHTCSPESIRRVTSRRAAQSPRMTVTRFSASSAGFADSAAMGSAALSRNIGKSGILADQAHQCQGEELVGIERHRTKREVKTLRFHLPGWMGCCQTVPLAA